MPALITSRDIVNSVGVQNKSGFYVAKTATMSCYNASYELRVRLFQGFFIHFYFASLLVNPYTEDKR